MNGKVQNSSIDVFNKLAAELFHYINLSMNALAINTGPDLKQQSIRYNILYFFKKSY